MPSLTTSRSTPAPVTAFSTTRSMARCGYAPRRAGCRGSPTSVPSRWPLLTPGAASRRSSPSTCIRNPPDWPLAPRPGAARTVIKAVRSGDQSMSMPAAGLANNASPQDDVPRSPEYAEINSWIGVEHDEVGWDAVVEGIWPAEPAPSAPRASAKGVVGGAELREGRHLLAH